MKRSYIFLIAILLFLSSCATPEALSESQMQNRRFAKPGKTKWKITIGKPKKYTPRDRGYWDIFNSNEGNPLL